MFALKRLGAVAAVAGLAAIGVAAAPHEAKAWWRGGFGVGVWIPPVVVAPPLYAPPVYAPPAYVPPAYVPPSVAYVPPPPYYPPPPRRVWVPPHWQGPYWIRGHWA